MYHSNHEHGRTHQAFFEPQKWVPQDFSEPLRELKSRFNHFIYKYSELNGTRNTKGTRRYDWETEFSYLTYEIEAGPEYMVPKIFDRANALINVISRACQPRSEQPA